MKSKYPHMLQPVQIGSKVLKNRLLSPCCMPHFITGPETFPSEATVRFFENLAKSGASWVTVREQTTDTSKIPLPDIQHTPYWNLDDKKVQNYYSLLADAIHFQGALASQFISVEAPMGFDVCDDMMFLPFIAGPDQLVPVKGIDRAQMDEIISMTAQKAQFYQGLGFDGCTIHMAYQGPLLAKFISPLCNKRADEYGGPMENRAKFPMEIFAAIKQACGKDFIIEIELSGEEPAGGYTLDEAIRFAKMCEGLVDIFQIRLPEIDPSHPTGYSYDGTPKSLQYSEAFKKAGVKGLIVPCGGFQQFDMIEDAIASGKCDAVDVARAFMVDDDFVGKAIEGRQDDVIPCVRCNKCHHMPKDKWATICSVNPMLGYAQRADKMVSAPKRNKKVAIVGGGPAGMRAALFCEERGHQVTIYEKGNVMGGQLIHADYPSFKWPLKNYKDWLIAQCGKRANITVLLGVEATPELLEAENYDSVIVAAGAEPKVPAIAGTESTAFWSPIGVYGHEAELGKRVVIVGGSESGTETGIYLAEAGHEVTVLTRNPMLAKDGQGVHFYSMMESKWRSLPNFRGITKAVTTAIADGKVTYTDEEGEHIIECDSIVLSGGVRARSEEIIRFHGCAPELTAAGDCVKPGALPDVNFTAYAAASKI